MLMNVQKIMQNSMSVNERVHTVHVLPPPRPYLCSRRAQGDAAKNEKINK